MHGAVSGVAGIRDVSVRGDGVFEWMDDEDEGGEGVGAGEEVDMRTVVSLARLMHASTSDYRPAVPYDLEHRGDSSAATAHATFTISTSTRSTSINQREVPSARTYRLNQSPPPPTRQTLPT